MSQAMTVTCHPCSTRTLAVSIIRKTPPLLAGGNPHATYIVAEGAGHLIHDDAPEFFRGAVEAFLSALPPAA